MASEQITVSSTAKQLTAATALDAHSAIIYVGVDAVRFKCDSPVAAPTATAGVYVATGNYIRLDSPEQIANIRIIRVTTDATIDVQYIGILGKPT